jgi:Rrf2 family protein
MLKLTKKADYGLIALCHLSRRATASATEANPFGSTASAKDIAELYRIPLPLLSKVLQTLVRNGLLASEQGALGGYRLARSPHDITTLEVIRTIDGPIILTDCFTEHSRHAQCDQTHSCPVRQPLRKVHEGILQLLSSITVADLSSEEMSMPSIAAIVSSIQPSSSMATSRVRT